MHRTEQGVIRGREQEGSEGELHNLASVYTTSVEIVPNPYLF